MKSHVTRSSVFPQIKPMWQANVLRHTHTLSHAHMYKSFWRFNHLKFLPVDLITCSWLIWWFQLILRHFPLFLHVNLNMVYFICWVFFPHWLFSEFMSLFFGCACVCVAYTCLDTPLSGVSLSWSGGTVLGRRYILSAAHWQPSPPRGSCSTGSCWSHTYTNTKKNTNHTSVQWHAYNIWGMHSMFIQVCEQCKTKSSCLGSRKVLFYFWQLLVLILMLTSTDRNSSSYCFKTLMINAKVIWRVHKCFLEGR